MATILLGTAASLPGFLAAAYLAGLASGLYGAPQQAVIADIIGAQARAGTAVATYQMMADLGSIAGSFAVGQLAQRLSFGWSFGISGAVLIAAAIGWLLAPETRGAEPVGRALDTDVLEPDNR